MPRLEILDNKRIGCAVYLLCVVMIPVSTVKAIANPVPFIDSISPLSTAPGASGFTLNVHGAGFLANSNVNWSVGVTTTALATTFVSSTQLQAAVPSALVTSPLTA